MKIINYGGCEYEVPDWARFVTTDEDGKVFVYSEKPYPEDSAREWWPEWPRVKVQQLERPDWKDSLVELEEGENNHDENS